MILQTGIIATQNQRRLLCLSLIQELSLIGLCSADIYQILNDLSHAFVLHNDFSTRNVVRAPKNTTVCSRHQRVHAWNLVDFPWVSVDDFDEGHAEKWRSLSKLQRDHFRFLHS